MTIITSLKIPRNWIVFLLTFGVLFYTNYFMMAKLPGNRNNLMCEIGANLTPLNVIFSLILSVMAGLAAAGMMEIGHRRKLAALSGAGSVSLVGILTGAMTSFCTLCTLPVISLFGVGVSLAFFTYYDLYFKALSIGLLGIALYLLNRQLKKQCFFGICRSD